MPVGISRPRFEIGRGDRDPAGWPPGCRAEWGSSNRADRLPDGNVANVVNAANAIDSVNSALRKVPENRCASPNDEIDREEVSRRVPPRDTIDTADFQGKRSYLILPLLVAQDEKERVYGYGNYNEKRPG